jgi:hypothetical protein
LRKRINLSLVQQIDVIVVIRITKKYGCLVKENHFIHSNLSRKQKKKSQTYQKQIYQIYNRYVSTVTQNLCLNVYFVNRTIDYLTQTIFIIEYMK